MKRTVFLSILATVVTASTAADTCMVSPTEKEIVSGRFGKFRGGGAANHGSSNQRPHMHDGLDFSGIRKSVWAPGGADDGAHGL